MATYASYRHIELDKVGYSKKRVRNPSSEILQVMSTSKSGSPLSCSTPNRTRSSDSFNRLFGTPEPGTPRRSSISKHDTSPRNPVTGDGVITWDSRPVSRNTPRLQRNPVTGETYAVKKSPPTTPIKLQNGYQNGLSNGLSNMSNGMSNGLSNGHHESPMINGKA